jgi:Abortive infection C-terminus
MADTPATAFTMFGARNAITGGLAHIDTQVDALERAVTDNPGLAFDLARTVVESTCRTIMIERGIVFDKDDDLPRLFKSLTGNLPLLPLAAAAEVGARKSLMQTLNGLHTALQGVCELRNAYGFASHGSAGPRASMESDQALLAAQAADAIIGFLHRVHRQESATIPGTRLEYLDSSAFNEYVDGANSAVQIFDLTYAPSEVLFGVDQDAYRELLAEFDSEVEPVASSTEDGSKGMLP